MGFFWTRLILEEWKSARSRRSGVSAANGSDTWRARARKHLGAATAAASIYEQDAHRALEHTVWTAAVNMQPGTS